MFFKHFATENQLPGFYISGALVEIEAWTQILRNFKSWSWRVGDLR